MAKTLPGIDVITGHQILLDEALVTHSFIPSVFHSSTQEAFLEYLLCARFCTIDIKC